MKKSILLLFFLLLFSCQGQVNRITKEDKEIMSTIIDELAYPMPPPPPIGDNDTIIPKKLVDSLLHVKMKLAIYPIMENSIDESGLKKIPMKYKKLYSSFTKPIFLNSINDIDSKKNHAIMSADTINIKESYDFKGFDLLYHFSRIWYDKEKTMAMFELGVSRSRLSGSSTIFCMKRANDKWIVEHTVPTTEW